MNRPNVRSIPPRPVQPQPAMRPPSKAASVGAVGSKTITVAGVQIHSVELEFCATTDLLGEFLQMVGSSAQADGQVMLGDIAAQFVGGRLTEMLPQLLASTSLIVPGAGQFDLNSREALNAAFTGRKKLIFPVVKLALEVSFADFLDGFELVGLRRPAIPGLKKTTEESPTEDSSPSTSETG